jgi:hypothetical protein
MRVDLKRLKRDSGTGKGPARPASIPLHVDDKQVSETDSLATAQRRWRTGRVLIVGIVVAATVVVRQNPVQAFARNNSSVHPVICAARESEES